MLCKIKNDKQKTLPGKFVCEKRLGTCKRLCCCNVENVTTKEPDDYVIATGRQFTVKQFVNLCAKQLNRKYYGKVV